jgi:hypothetical protein
MVMIIALVLAADTKLGHKLLGPVADWVVRLAPAIPVMLVVTFIAAAFLVFWGLAGVMSGAAQAWRWFFARVFPPAVPAAGAGFGGGYASGTVTVRNPEARKRWWQRLLSRRPKNETHTPGELSTPQLAFTIAKPETVTWGAKQVPMWRLAVTNPGPAPVSCSAQLQSIRHMPSGRAIDVGHLPEKLNWRSLMPNELPLSVEIPPRETEEVDLLLFDTGILFDVAGRYTAAPVDQYEMHIVICGLELAVRIGPDGRGGINVISSQHLEVDDLWF